jgi:hypothetical protein
MILIKFDKCNVGLIDCFIKLQYFFLNPHSRCKCNVGCIVNFVRLSITRESKKSWCTFLGNITSLFTWEIFQRRRKKSPVYEDVGGVFFEPLNSISWRVRGKNFASLFSLAGSPDLPSRRFILCSCERPRFIPDRGLSSCRRRIRALRCGTGGSRWLQRRRQRMHISSFNLI